jgi:hypothetical protein
VFTSPSSVRQLLAFTTALTMLLPALPAAAQDDSASGGAPPSRVGQIASLNGNVSFNGSGSGGWAQAALNYPVSAGDTLYTQDSAQASIALDSSRIALAGNTELQVTTLDQNDFAATQSQGEAVYVISDLQPGQQFAVTTPRGTVGITENGEYDITAGDTTNPTTVDVFQGAATVTDPGANVQLAAGQAAYLTGTDQTVAQVGQAQQDSFAGSVLAQNAPPPPSYAPPVVRQMTGTAELSQYGSWNQSPQYGAVWYPSVAPGWAPYREGHWANIQPWGWTWVESEPWGFAPFHYGRWIDDGNRWGWAPAPAYSEGGGYGPSYQPVYAPAVVSFFGLALAAGITAAALSSGSVGWVPLAPDEPYYPTYRCPPAYVRQINYVNVRDIKIVNVTNNYYGGHYTPDKLANRRGATYVSADVMRHGEHVASYARPASQAMLNAARPIDTGNHPGQHAGYRLPEAARPLAQQRPGTAPRPTEFAQRHNLPPATLSHQPYAGRPAATAPHAAMGQHQTPPVQAGNQPEFATAPGYHAPPPPPAAGEHLNKLPPAQNFRPASTDNTPRVSHPAPEPIHPQNPHPMPASQAYHPPAEVARPPVQHLHPQNPHPVPAAPAYHPAAQANHPPAQTYHPPAEVARPPVEQSRPQPVSQPRPVEMQHPHADNRPEQPHPDRQKHQN